MYLVNQSLIVIIVNTALLALFYFYAFGQTKKRYIGLFSLSWAMLFASFLIDINKFNYNPIGTFVVWKMMFGLASSLLLYYASMEFIGQKVPGHWLILTLAAFTWVNVSLFFFHHLTVVTLPLCILVAYLSLSNGLKILLYEWGNEGIVKHIAGWTIIFIGFHHAYYPFIKPNIYFSHLEYTTATILTTILNICALTVYFERNQIELSEREKSFRFLTENARDFIYQYLVSPAPKLIYASPASIAITGYTPEELYSDPNLLVERVYPEDRYIIKNFMQSPQNSQRTFTFRWVRKDGQVIILEQNSTVICNEHGDSIAVEGILRDITERKKAEEKVQRMEQSRRHLLANISHDLQTPMTTIQAYMQAIVDGIVKEKEAQMQYVNIALQKAKGVNRLIQDLFDLSQIETGKVSLRLKEITVEEIMSKVKEKYQLDVEGAGIHFLVSGLPQDASATVSVVADPDRIDQVFGNLIYNAIRYTSPGGMIKISCKIYDFDLEDSTNYHNHVVFLVQDNGVGIPETDLPFLFDGFYKRNKNRSSKDGGSGLGLAICKEIVAMHKGSIWVESKLGEGSIFSFTLPLYIVDDT